MKKNNYSSQVFMNCPFDDKYLKIFQATVFTILDCGFIPRCSLEVDDATEFRLRAIVKLIKRCKYGIHDLSRVELDATTNLPRFNMPFELGVFYGAKVFGKSQDRSKSCIILEKEKWRYQQFISDLSGVDITDHNNSVKRVIIAVRNWIVTSSKRKTVPKGSTIYSRYLKFQVDFLKACEAPGVDNDTIPFVEFTRNITDWLRINQEVHHRLFS